MGIDLREQCKQENAFDQFRRSSLKGDDRLFDECRCMLFAGDAKEPEGLSGRGGESRLLLNLCSGRWTRMPCSFVEDAVCCFSNGEYPHAAAKALSAFGFLYGAFTLGFRELYVGVSLWSKLRSMSHFLYILKAWKI